MKVVWMKMDFYESGLDENGFDEVGFLMKVVLDENGF